MSKAEETKKYIIKTAAPIFNKYGYVSTSMGIITQATQLTKGAIYGNFKNKEDLAIQAFNYNIKRVFKSIRNTVDTKDSAIGKLLVIVDFYSNYLEYTKKFGGCPIINVGVDSNNQNTKLIQHVRTVIKRTHDYIEDIIELGKKQGEIKPEINSKDWAIRIDTMIQGATFIAGTMNNNKYLEEMTIQLYEIIDNQLKL